MDVPQIIAGRFRIECEIGTGGMGTVYRAEDTRTGAPVAVKVLDEARTRDPQILSRFRREARIATALRHPNIAAFHDFDEAVVPSGTGGAKRRVVFLVIEWVEGEDLTAALQRKERFAAARLAEIARQLTAALEAAHAVGVVHRDLKPSNIRVTPDGRVKVLDFGLAKILENAQLHRDHPPTFQTSNSHVREEFPTFTIRPVASIQSPACSGWRNSTVS